jgi:hypothetical protein
MRGMRQDHLKVRMHHAGSAGVKIVTADLGIFDATHFMCPSNVKIRQFKGAQKSTWRKFIKFQIMFLGDGDDRRISLVSKEVREEDGYQAALQLLKLPVRPTALLVINDLLAIGALRAPVTWGLRVPADLSVVGYDDIPLASYLTPRLTTSSKDMVRVGREAVKMLLARIQDPDRPHQRVDIQARFIIRESTGPASV